MSDEMDRLFAELGLLALPPRHVERVEQLWMAGQRHGGLRWRPPYNSRFTEYDGPSGCPENDDSPGKFWIWLMLRSFKNNEWRDDPVGDLAKDIWRDAQFPKGATPAEALSYICEQNFPLGDREPVMAAIADAIELFGKAGKDLGKRMRYRHVSPSLRFKIMHRDKYTCQTCGAKPPDTALEIDHRQSIRDGGTDDESNLWTLCVLCNRGKAGRSL